MLLNFMGLETWESAVLRQVLVSPRWVEGPAAGKPQRLDPKVPPSHVADLQG